MSADRDATMRDMAHRISVLANGTPMDLTVGGVVLFLVAQCDNANDPAFDKYVAAKLRAVADVLSKAERPA